MVGSTGSLHDESMMTNTHERGLVSPGRLDRPMAGRWVAGVARGLSDRYDVGVGIVRLGFVLLTFAGGFGIVLYLAGWLMMPDEGQDESIVERTVGSVHEPGRWLGIGLIAVAGLIFIGWTGLVRGELLFAGVLVLAGLLLYRGDLPGRPPRPVSEPGSGGSDTAAAATVVADPVTNGADQAETLETPGEDAAGRSRRSKRREARRPPRPPRQSSPLGLYTIGTVLVVFGIMAALAPSKVLERDLRDVLGAAFIVIGAGLVVGTWFGRARSLIALGIVMLPLAAAAFIVQTPLRGDVGDITHRIRSFEASPVYEQLAGEMSLDLTDVPAGETGRLEASLGFGTMRVFLPRDLDPILDARVGAGVIDLPSLSRAGLDVERTIDLGGDGSVVLDLHVGIGNIEVMEVEDS
jgi:phage shock protein PspC (stress-responsive transcriptional regulator)/HAMP domain-containing protein